MPFADPTSLRRELAARLPDRPFTIDRTRTVKARAYVKVTKGKSPTKSISSKIKVCS